MRLAPVGFSVALALAIMASAGQGQLPGVPVNPRSVALVRQGQVLAASRQYDAAIDMLETALAMDPRNHSAYIALARVAQAQGLPGKAIGLYGQALKLVPEDIDALAGQGEAYAQRGAIERAKLNLEKVKKACKGRSCSHATTLAATIAKQSAAQAPNGQAR